MLFSCIKGPVDDPANNPLKPLSLTTKSAEFVQKGAVFNLEFLERIDASANLPYSLSAN